MREGSQIMQAESQQHLDRFHANKLPLIDAVLSHRLELFFPKRYTSFD
jgi:hypothetical protein